MAYRKKLEFLNEENYNMINDGNVYEFTEQKPGLNIYFDKSNLADKLPHIPDYIKYLVLRCEPVHYPDIPRLLASKYLTYVKLEMTLSGILHHNLLDYIKFPPSIKSLTLTLDDDIEYDHLDRMPQAPDEVIENAVKMIQAKSIIPSDIEYLKINFHLANIHEYTSLKVYIIDDFQNNEYNYPMANLPPMLEWLEILPIKFNQPLLNLPSNLKVLIFAQNRIWNYYDGYKHSLDNLPIPLEVLYFPECMSLEGISYKATLEHLPPNLKILHIPELMPENMNYNSLPDSIEILEWPGFYNHYKNITRFPASLKTIKIKTRSRSNNYNDDNDVEIQNYFKDATFTIEIIPCF